VESNRAVGNAKALAKVADALIVARNDLGVAVGKDKLEPTQARIAKIAHGESIGLVIGGAFLKSMLGAPEPSKGDARAFRTARDLAPRWVLLTPTATAKDPSATVAAARKLLDE